MLALKTQPKYVKKVVHLPNGAFALVVFELVSVNGKTVAKAVCGKIIGEETVGKQEVCALPVYEIAQNIKPIVSPYFKNIVGLIKDFSFFVSQPVRAPNF